MKTAAFFLAALHLATVLAGAQTPAPPEAAAAPVAAPAATLPHLQRLVRSLKVGADNVRAQGSFGAQLWLVADARFYEDWRKPESPTIDPVATAVRGQSIFTVIVFYGPARDEKGQANVLYDLVVRRPDGSVYSERKDIAGFQAATPTDPRMLLLGRGYLNIRLGPDDPAGKYTVEATVRDAVAKVDLPLKKEFVVE